MKKLITNSLLSIFMLLLPVSLHSQGFLHRDGKKIVDGNGQEVMLRGMGLGGWMIQEGYMMETGSFAGTQHELKAKITDLAGESGMNEFYDAWLKNNTTRADIDSMAKWGFNSIRLPMHYNLFTLPIEKEPVSGQNTWLDKGFVMVDSLLKWCAANQMYLILDLHAAPGGQGHDANISDYDNTKPSLWESAGNRAKTVALWGKLAERYAGQTWIGGYDLINEPNWDLPNGTMLRMLYQDIINAIRTVDNNHMVFIEGNWFANTFDGLLPSPNLMDQNMAYSFHKYWNATNTSSIQWMLDISNNYNVPLWLGESGENSNEWFRQTIKMLEGNNIGWSWWPLKKINNTVGPATIIENPEYRTLLNYWGNGGTKPTAEYAKNALMKLADNARIQNCIIHPDVIDAMFRQVNEDTSKPFKNLTIPGTISFTDFDLGKVNVAYWDADNLNDKETSTVGNNGGGYRNDGIDIEACTDTEIASGYNVGWIIKNEWMNYTVNVAENGYYDVAFRVSSNVTGGLFHVEVNGTDVTGTVSVPYTSGYQSWQTIEIKNIPLVKGSNTMTFRVDQGGFNINSMKWTGPTSVTSVPLRLLSAYTSEDGTLIYLNFSEDLKSGLSLSASSFFLSKGSIVNISSVEQSSGNARQIILHISGNLLYTDVLTLSYNGTSISTSGGKVLDAITSTPVVNKMLSTLFIPGKIEAENYTVNNGLSSEDCSDTGGGKDIGYTDVNDYLEYLVYISTGGTYSVDVRYATPDQTAKVEFSLYDENVKTVLTSVDLPQTGDFQMWSTKTATLNLPSGIHTLRYTVLTPRFNTNYLKFTLKSTSTGPSIENKDVVVYPNPSTGMVYLLHNKLLGNNFDLEIVDLCGKSSYKQNVRNSEDVTSIDMSGKSKGIYFLKLQSGSFKTTKKFVID